MTSGKTLPYTSRKLSFSDLNTDRNSPCEVSLSNMQTSLFTLENILHSIV